jgi:DnaJ-class molecular chaperone
MRGQDRRYSLEIPFLDAVLGGKTRITLPDGGMLDVKIPQGTTDQQTIRLRGKGNPGFEGGAAGDALVTLTVRPHPIFRREGNDILITLPITLDEAVLGGKVETPTIEGAVKLTIPKGASSGQTLRMRARGVKSADKPAGDQRVELQIVTPPKGNEELEKFMENWRKTNTYDPRKGMKI